MKIKLNISLQIILLFVLFMHFSIKAQNSGNNIILDSLIHKNGNLKFNYKQLIIPTVFISYGLIGLESDALKGVNLDIRNEVVEDIDKKFTVDDYLQYLPALSVYALNNCNIQGKNNLKDRSVILGTSMVIVFSTVTSLKRITNQMRPDGTKYSFPSGHTALAFAGAEFLYQEYKDQSIWYGISGYTVATVTGMFRMYNNKHWLTDVVAGAGIGILSTKIAYWINPYLNEKIFKTKSKNTTTMFTPYYDGKQMGGSLVFLF